MGQVTEISGSVIRVKGYVFVIDENLNGFVRQDDLRERLFGNGDAGLVLNSLSPAANLVLIGFTMEEMSQWMLTDGEIFSPDSSEGGPRR